MQGRTMLNANNLCTLFMRQAIEKVGGFDPKLRFKEDQDMGDRLAEAGYQIIGDPELQVYPSISNTVRSTRTLCPLVYGS